MQAATGGWLALARLVVEAMTGTDHELPRAAAARYLNQVLVDAHLSGVTHGASAADLDEMLRLSLADHLDDAVFDDATGPRDQLELRLINACAALRAHDHDAAAGRWTGGGDLAKAIGASLFAGYVRVAPDDLYYFIVS